MSDIENGFSPKERLITYLGLFSRGEMDARSFAGSFEQVYNLELNKADLTEIQANAFASLFEKVVWFSPYEEEVKSLPNYVGAHELLAEARKYQWMLTKPEEGKGPAAEIAPPSSKPTP